MLYYEEVFVSVQGEGLNTGLPCVFVRLFGCNLDCTYCDTPQPPSRRRRISVENMVNRVREHRVNYVCITGGEPLMQGDVYPLIYELVGLGYRVSIETNGSFLIDPSLSRRSYSYTMDVKCPSSGESDKNRLMNLGNLLLQDEVKFVIRDEEDYKYARKVLRTYPTCATILFSPVYEDGKPVIGQELVDWLIRDGLHYVRVQVQMHKALGLV